MTENLDKAFELANLMTVVNNQKSALLSEFEQSTLYFYNGGTFRIDQNFIAFITALKDLKQDSAVLIDLNKHPIQIENLLKFREDVINCFFSASNKYLFQYQKLISNKNIESILEI